MDKVIAHVKTFDYFSELFRKSKCFVAFTTVKCNTEVFSGNKKVFCAKQEWEELIIFIILKERKSYEIVKKSTKADDIKEAINYVTSTQG
jgi:hypothetical protein